MLKVERAGAHASTRHQNKGSNPMTSNAMTSNPEITDRMTNLSASAQRPLQLGSANGQTTPVVLTRRAFAGSLTLGLGLTLSGCIGAFDGRPPGMVGGFSPERETDAIGDGDVRVALILPLSASGAGGAAARDLRNAAQLALEEFDDPAISLIVKDDRGSADGALNVAEEAVAEGAELILGPLFAASVQAAGQVARQNGVPVIAFSTDASVARQGVYLMGFLPRAEVGRIMDYTASQNRRNVAALIPESGYGEVAESAFRDAARRRDMQIVALERYRPGSPGDAVRRLGPAVSGNAPRAEALFLPDTPDSLPGVARALAENGFDPGRVKPIGTGVWNDPDVLRLPALRGGWFAGPPQAGFEAFTQRYRSRFGGDPVRIATLAYDGVSLAAALTRTQGDQRFAESVLTNASGFAGADGVFRFNRDGSNDRGYAVYEVRDGQATTIAAAPQALGS
jgi:ABC-type branched-subunit amino acid transport system substrate-binding protein